TRRRNLSLERFVGGRRSAYRRMRSYLDASARGCDEPCGFVAEMWQSTGADRTQDERWRGAPIRGKIAPLARRLLPSHGPQAMMLPPRRAAVIVTLFVLTLAPAPRALAAGTPAPGGKPSASAPAAAKTDAPAKSSAPAKTDPDSLFRSGTFSGLKFRSIGPAMTSGRIVDIAIHPSSPHTWYVASASGGVWKTVNAGVSWDPIFDDQGSYSIGCVTIDPKNPLIVWVGTGENNSQRSVGYGDGVYKSIDGGKNWS